MDIEKRGILITALTVFFLISAFLPANAEEKLILYDMVITKVEFLPPNNLGFRVGAFIGSTILTFGNEGTKAFGGTFSGYIPLNRKVNVHYDPKHDRILGIKVVQSR